MLLLLFSLVPPLSMWLTLVPLLGKLSILCPLPLLLLLLLLLLLALLAWLLPKRVLPMFRLPLPLPLRLPLRLQPRRLRCHHSPAHSPARCGALQRHVTTQLWEGDGGRG